MVWLDVTTDLNSGAHCRDPALLQTRSCDKITISPALLDELEKSTTPLERKLSPEK
jgi:hypothetical protein